MSSLEKFFRVLRCVPAIALALSLAACFRPLYGPTASGGSLVEELASIEVADVAVRRGYESFTHYLRSELIYSLNGSNRPTAKRYVLNIVVEPRIDAPLVDTATGRAQSATLVATATYTLTNLDGTEIIATERATGSVSYDRNVQRFATVRAQRDAEIRMSKILTDQIRTRLSIFLADR